MTFLVLVCNFAKCFIFLCVISITHKQKMFRIHHNIWFEKNQYLLNFTQSFVYFLNANKTKLKLKAEHKDSCERGKDDLKLLCL